MLKGIIFDLDGVICHTDEYHFQAWKRIAEQEHIHFDREINNRLRGVSRMESLEIILEKAGRTYTQVEKTALAEQKNNYYRELLGQMTPADLAEETKEVLHTLRQWGLKLAIGSSSKNTRLILGRIGLGEFFDAISDGNNIVNTKPDPEVFLKAAQMLELPPRDCLVVEDAQAGIQAANSGGFRSAAIGDARKSEQATFKLDAMKQLPELILKIYASTQATQIK